VSNLNRKISKFLSYVLRHHPQKFGIQLDSQGYANLAQILSLFNGKFKDHVITKTTLEELIIKSDKKRFEIMGNKIRATYGHSLEKKIIFPRAKMLPPYLYHGTTLLAAQKILNEGLKPKGRQYVHLSKEISMAIKVGKRRTSHPIVLIIDCEKARKLGITFFISGDLYLSEYIPPECISKL